jgi:hypothetical protein
MEFLDISSLGATYRYVVKIEQKIKQKTRKFGSENPSQQKNGKGNPNPHNKGQSKYGKSIRQSVQAANKEGQWKDEQRYREVVQLP